MIERCGRLNQQDIIDAALAWRGTKMALATVVSTWGSAPRPTGSHLLMSAGDRFVGSVSGGCVESEILHLAGEILRGAPSVLRRYGVADGRAWEVGLPCGGEIGVLVQPVSDEGFAPSLFDRVAHDLDRRATSIVATDLASGQSECVDRADPNRFTNIYLPPRRMLIVGAVDIAQSLATIARAVGFAVTVIDPRPMFLTAERFPGCALDDRWPDEAVAALAPDGETAVVTLSHDVKIDDPALAAALRSRAGYVAALGSTRSHQARLERLGAMGFDAAALARIEGPAGVPIGAKGSAEIALSIASGAVAAFRRVPAD